jgi:hypothetical protein
VWIASCSSSGSNLQRKKSRTGGTGGRNVKTMRRYGHGGRVCESKGRGPMSDDEEQNEQ